MKFLKSPKPWGLAFIFWAFTLYFLSSFSKPIPVDGPEIPNLDKILHFGYFFGGAILFCLWLDLRRSSSKLSLSRLLFPFLLFCAIGALDEYHQTCTPGRSGNDFHDWLADILGASTGIYISALLHPFLLKRF
ncbi:MAG: VanZ family protein [Akkermansiaceae bacterium]